MREFVSQTGAFEAEKAPVKRVQALFIPPDPVAGITEGQRAEMLSLEPAREERNEAVLY